MVKVGSEEGLKLEEQSIWEGHFGHGEENRIMLSINCSNICPSCQVFNHYIENGSKKQEARKMFHEEEQREHGDILFDPCKTHESQMALRRG